MQHDSIDSSSDAKNHAEFATWLHATRLLVKWFDDEEQWLFKDMTPQEKAAIRALVLSSGQHERDIRLNRAPEKPTKENVVKDSVDAATRSNAVHELAAKKAVGAFISTKTYETHIGKVWARIKERLDVKERATDDRRSALVEAFSPFIEGTNANRTLRQLKSYDDPVTGLLRKDPE